MSEAAPIQLHEVSHAFGDGELRKQILYEITTEIRSGEIVILTGPSGSGKTTLLTLIGALRSAQEGSVQVLGEELRGAGTRQLVQVRRQIGYIFQLHNLIEALSARQNVEMALQLQPELSAADRRRRAAAMLESVGLGDRVEDRPGQLSGGQKQRVAIARALVNQPRIILADEPTASLDRQSGRDAVDLMQRLAKEQGVTVVLVTHDNRILDIADRIIHLEDGRLSSFTEAVLANTRKLMSALIQSNRRGELMRHVLEMPEPRFNELLEQVTGEARQLLYAAEVSRDDAFESMLAQVLAAFSYRIADLIGAERCSLFLVDESRSELWSKVARSEGDAPLEIRIPMGSGIAGAVAASGESVNVPDAYADDRFDRSVDQDTGYRTRNLLCCPILDEHERVFAVAQLLNKKDGAAFAPEDEARFAEFLESLGVILESWWRMSAERGDGPAAAG